MIAEAIRRSPLADYAERFAALYETTRGAVSIRELPFFTQINIRMDPTGQAVMKRLAGVLGFDLPPTSNTVASIAGRRALWLGPDEWLIVGAADEAKGIQRSLHDALAGVSASIVDVSASRTVLLIQGGRARELLAHGIAIDLHPHAFAPGRCAQTLLAKAQVIIERGPDQDQAFRLFVRTSFASYVAEWLLEVTADPEVVSRV